MTEKALGKKPPDLKMKTFPSKDLLLAKYHVLTCFQRQALLEAAEVLIDMCVAKDFYCTSNDLCTACQLAKKLRISAGEER